MNPTRLRARNYRTFDELDVQLPGGCVAVIGDNGAGKSSIVNVVDLALFGTRSFAPYLQQDGASDLLELELTFEHDNELYRVRRSFSAKGRGKATLDLERNALRDEQDERGERPDSWLPLTRESVKETQAALEQLIGLNRTTFRASSFLQQGDGAAFTEADPAARKEILFATLGLDVWPRLLELVRRDRRAAERQIDQLNGRVADADERLAARGGLEIDVKVADDVEREATSELAAAQERLERARTRLQELETVETRLRALAAAVDAARETVRAHERVQRDADQAAEEILTLRAHAAALSSDERLARLEQAERDARDRQVAAAREVAVHRARVEQRNSAAGARASLNAQVDQLLAQASKLRILARDLSESHADEQVCVTCGQRLGEDARERAAKSYRQELAEVEARATALTCERDAVEIPDVPDATELEQAAAAAYEELQTVDADLRAARQDVAARTAVEERIRGLERTAAAAAAAEYLAAVDEATRSLADAERAVAELPILDLPALDDARRQRDVAAREVEQQQERIRAARDQLARARALLEQLDELEQRSKTDRQAREHLLVDLDDLTILERAYGRDGVPSLIVAQSAIPAIETEANRILAELGTSYRVELRTERELKTGGVGDTLDVVVVTETGERPFETFSGGERSRLNVALRIALAELLAGRRRAESRLLVLDEVEYLDAAGHAALVGVLRGLEDRFSKILLVSHVPDLRDAFDTTITVVKDDDGRSRIAA